MLLLWKFKTIVLISFHLMSWDVKNVANKCFEVSILFFTNSCTEMIRQAVDIAYMKALFESATFEQVSVKLLQALRGVSNSGLFGTLLACIIAGNRVGLPLIKLLLAQ